MGKKIVIVKLGGSVITQKDKESIPNLETIQRGFQELANADVHPIVVHGAGSYGHPMAKKYDLVSGFTPQNREKAIWAVSQTRLNMISLHHLIIKEALAKGFFPFSFPVSSNTLEITENSFSFFSDPLTVALKQGFNPFFYGDVVLSKFRGFTILSGDKIIEMILKTLNGGNYFPEEVIVCSDVDGFFSDDPKLNPDAEMFPMVKKSDIPNLIAHAKESNNPDVTKGMLGKIESIEKILSYGAKVKIVNLNVAKRLENAFDEEKIYGTTFMP